MMTEAELRRFGEQWDKAMLSNDAAEIGRFMSDDWVIVGTEGGITTKVDFLEWISFGSVFHTRIGSDETRIKIYGNSGVVISRGTTAGIYNGCLLELHEWSTSVFIHNGDSWKCVATMLTKANHPDN